MTKLTRLNVTDEQLADTQYAWTGDVLFGLSNAQLHRILEAREVVFETDANKKTLVTAIVDDQIAKGIRGAGDQGDEPSDETVEGSVEGKGDVAEKAAAEATQAMSQDELDAEAAAKADGEADVLSPSLAAGLAQRAKNVDVDAVLAENAKLRETVRGLESVISQKDTVIDSLNRKIAAKETTFGSTDNLGTIDELNAKASAA